MANDAGRLSQQDRPDANAESSKVGSSPRKDMTTVNVRLAPDG